MMGRFMKLNDVAEVPPRGGFPEDFLWGVAMSAKQAEGAATEDGRGLTVADLQDYNPQDTMKVKGDFTRDQILERLEHPEHYWFPKKQGIDFRHTYREDLALLAELGIKAFRTSICWSRVFPNGDDEKPSDEGIAFYEDLFSEVRRLGLEPIVTIYHDDMPVSLALRFNGFLSRHVVDAYVWYATLMMDRLRMLVRYWIPVNQINLTRVGLSSLGIVRDTVDNLEAAKFQAVHNKFVACARVAEAGRTICPDFKFGSMLADFYQAPATCCPADMVLSTEKNQMTMFFFSDVQFRGEYPGYALRYFEDNGIEIQVEPGDLEVIADNTMDYLALSYYNSNVVSADKNSMAIGDYTLNPYLKANPWGWTVNPDGLYDCLTHYWDRWRKPILIAENGFGQVEQLDANDTVEDDYRVDYIREHLKALRKAIAHGVKVFSYCAWSPLDMVSSGTSEMRKRYGFVYVDLDDMGGGTGERYKKKSFDWYRRVCASNGEEGL